MGHGAAKLEQVVIRLVLLITKGWKAERRWAREWMDAEQPDEGKTPMVPFRAVVSFARDYFPFHKSLGVGLCLKKKMATDAI